MKAYWHKSNRASSQFPGIRNLPERNKFRSLFQKQPKCDTRLSDSEDMSREYFWNCSYADEIRETPDTVLLPLSAAEQLIGVSARRLRFDAGERILVFAEKP